LKCLVQQKRLFVGKFLALLHLLKGLFPSPKLMIPLGLQISFLIESGLALGLDSPTFLYHADTFFVDSKNERAFGGLLT